MKRKILIVEDNEMNRELLHNILEREYEVFDAVDGQDALEFLRRKHKMISAVLLDLDMPVLNGFEVLKQRSCNPALSQIPVIVVTALNDEETEIKALSLGANDFVAKPYKPSLLLHCLRNTINLRETASILNAIQLDKLTGLYNRDAFFNKVTIMIREQKPGFYVMDCFDIDNFKLINDQYGAIEGDGILTHIGKVVRENISAIGGVCSRISADNFALLYPYGKRETAFVNSLRDEKLIPETPRIALSFSVGRYIITDLSLSASTIYDRAHIAKRAVKGRYDTHVAYFDESMLEKLVNEQMIINEMDLALACGQFETWYQPQFNHATGALIGAEALARWRHPRRGMISPGEFIPVFEQNGFVYELDKFIWEQVCAHLKKWKDEGREPLPVSVNISRYDVFREDLTDVIVGLTEKYGISADLLRLEITESAFAKSSEQIIEVVRSLIKRGFIVEVDDFGSGYSSLNTLKDVPASVLKLDMRFLEGSGNSQRGGNILESVVRMAKWLNMSVIAEGVETIEQADFLHSIGANYIQGYLYSKPVPAEKYELMARNATKEQHLLALETVANLDNNAFWDPRSMDTLIFNSYIGGACIFEYHEGRIELLRANEKYARVIGSSGMTVESALKLNWAEHLGERGGAKLVAALKKSIDTGDEVAEEFEFFDLPGCPHKTYLRSTMRVIANTGDRQLVYCTNENMTAQRIAEEKERRSAEQVQAIMEDVGSGITATIIEDGRMRFLLANSKYYDILGYTKEQYESEIRDIYDTVHPADRERAAKMRADAYASERSVQAEYRIIRRDGAERWLSAMLSTTRFTGIDRPVQLSVFTDVTDKMLSEQKLRETDESLRFLNEMAHGMLSQPDNAAGLDGVLQKLLVYFGGSRAYIFELNHAERTFNNTYEACAEGVSHEKDNLQNMPLDMMPLWLRAFEKDDCINIADVDALDDSRAEERAVLLAQGIKSLIAVPLRRDGCLIGFVGIDDPTERHAQVDRMAALGDYITEMLTHRDLDAKIMSDSRTVLELMNDTPGGFERAQIHADGSMIPLYVNDGLCKLIGRSRDELLSPQGGGLAALTHPDDADMARDAVRCMISGAEVSSPKFRMLNGAGDYIWVRLFARSTKNESGAAFLNVYYTDASEENRIEEQRKELLDNLPCGAALYEYDGENIAAVHLNMRYRELVGREIRGLSGLTVLSCVHPDDRGELMAELKRAISEGRDLEYDGRILFGGEGEYGLFHIVGRIIPREDGKYSIYAAYTPIADEALAYQEMLPVALAAAVSLSEEPTFVKDRQHRYVCCNSSFAKRAGLANEKDIIGKTDYDLLDASYADKYTAGEKALIEKGVARLHYEEVMPSADGSVVYADTSKYPLLDSQGNVIGIYCVARDVTRAHKLDSQLKALTDSIPGGLATYQCANGRVKNTYFNDGFARLFGYAREEYARICEKNPISLVFEEDLPALMEQLNALIADSGTMERICRVHVKGGGYKWISCKGAAERNGELTTVNVVLLDVTELQESMERLRISEEEHRLAVEHGGNAICRYDVATHTLTMAPASAMARSMPEVVANVPYGPIREGYVGVKSAEAYRSFFESILNGEENGVATFEWKRPNGWRWIEAHFSSIFSADKKPISAVVSFVDVTEKLEKETVYKKWRQSLRMKAPAHYTLFRCNLSKNASFDTVDGGLLKIKFDPALTTFNERTAEYVGQCVFEEDKERYCALLDSKTLLEGFYSGAHTYAMEYRENTKDGGVRWIGLTVDLVEYPKSNDVEAYLMYEDIDERKRAELLTIERAERDPLTGVLNRTTFASRANALIAARPEAKHALLMLDVDGFKLVNDVFGHAAGDDALTELARALSSIVRKGDLLGRLGGDEFMVFLNDIPNDAAASNMAKRICALTRRSFSVEVQISASVGIAICPRDGADCTELYKKVDAALYHVKGAGRNNFAFYRAGMERQHLELCVRSAGTEVDGKKRRMLVVSDNSADADFICGAFKDDFIIERAQDGQAALTGLRHYGSAISVVILDLEGEELNSLAVLERMKLAPELKGIPAIVISGENDRETGLKSISCGAADFVMRPVDAKLIRIRVQSAVSKAENERMLAQNNLLEQESDELKRCRAVLEHAGVVMIEHDRESGGFTYGAAASRFIAGIWDERGLWDILLQDNVADEDAVRAMQKLIDDVYEDERHAEGITVALQTPSKGKRLFYMSVYKLSGERQTADELIITLNDTGIATAP